MLEAYQAYATYDDIAELTRSLVQASAQAVFGSLTVDHVDGTSHDLSGEWRSVTLHEAVSEAIRDIDFGRAQIIIRSAKGDKDRIVMLPATLRGRLAGQLDEVEERWRKDVARGGGCKRSSRFRPAHRSQVFPLHMVWA